jgi:hypothetical protein
MDTSPGVAITISLVLAIVLTTCPVTGSLSLPAGGLSATGIIAGVPGAADDVTLARAISVDDSSNGKTVHVASGDAILVQLDEQDPDQTWHYSGDDGFKVVGDVVLQMYPARHDFRVKALRPGDLRFNKVDRRDGYVIDTFTVRVSLDQENPAATPRKTHPLQMLRTISQVMNAFRFWH